MGQDLVLELKNVEFSYEGASSPALKNVNLSVRRGEFLSIVGHNGSGKSTLSRLFNGLIFADGGEVLVCGENVAQTKDLLSVRKKVGIVFQNPDNQAVASIVEDDIAFGPENIGVEREEIGRRIEWALNAVGMKDYRGSMISKLSGGQKQRVAVAGVLAIKPEILVLDESTAMLDPRGRKEVINVIKALNKEEGITVILITHFLDEALLADRTVVMNRGEIVLTGTPGEIFKNGEALETFNLALPNICGITRALRAGGMEIDEVLTPGDMAAEILKNFKNRGIGAGQSHIFTPENKKRGGEWDIVIRDLEYTYSKKTEFASKALKGVNLTIPEGAFFGLLGHTGSGKSTLVQHLNALIKLPQAEKKYKKPKAKKGVTPVFPHISVGKFDLSDKKCNFNALRASLGMVFQYPEYQLFSETVFGDVAFGLKNFSKNLSEDEIKEAVKSSLEIVGLNYNEVKDKSPFDLSGGQKRRVAIAGVIVTKPEILVLDEPAAGLDPKGKSDIMELLHVLHKNWCKTVIIVSHDMDEIAENCTECAVLSDGKVFDAGAPYKVFRRESELKGLGLDIPLTAKIANILKEEGYNADCDLTKEGFCRAVLSLFGGAEC